MVKDVNELKELLEWARSQGIKSLSVGDVQVEFIELTSHISDLSSDPKPSREEKSSSTKILSDTENMTPEEEEELLFHSARP